MNHSHHDMDHAGMDHDHMSHDQMPHDHTGHNMNDMTSTAASSDHSHHAMGMSMEHMMSMYFHFGYEETVLFQFWKVASVGGLLGSMFGIFIMAALYEGLKYYREYLFWKTYHALQYRSVQVPVNKQVVDADDTVVHVLGEVIHKQPATMWSSPHAFQTFLHAIQMILSYMLMLIFMTYNVWLCIAVVLGAATGYFLFGWKKSVIVDVTEHCH